MGKPHREKGLKNKCGKNKKQSNEQYFVNMDKYKMWAPGQDQNIVISQG